MKVTYLTPAKSGDRHGWSGLSYFMRLSLEKAELKVEVIDSLRFPAALWPERAVRSAMNKTGLAGRHVWNFDPRVVHDYARQVEQALAKSKADVIFSSGTVQIADLKASQPIVYWGDATFGGLVNYYFQENELTPATLRSGNEMERAAIHKSRCGIYASDWAAESAHRLYDADPARVEVIPFGANLYVEPEAATVAQWIDQRMGQACRLLFLGVDWERKGGPETLEVVKLLREQGVPCELTVAGCSPPRGTVLPEGVHVLGFVNKNSVEGRELLNRLLIQSHFLIVPSRAECFGLVFAEANAYGLPALATREGGIPSAIRNGINGFCVPRGEGLVRGLAGHIKELLREPDKYHALAQSSYQEYVTRLNWKTSGERIRALLEKL